MATLVVNWLRGSSVRLYSDLQEPARSQNTSVSIDARVSVYPMGEEHPLAHLFGKYADNPMWRELDEIMDRNRISSNANGDVE